MYTKPQVNDFVRSTDGLVRGFIRSEGVTPYKGGELPTYRIYDGHREHIVPGDSVQIINRGGLPWAEWLRVYRKRPGRGVIS